MVKVAIYNFGSQQPHKLIEQIFGVGWSRAGFGVELDGEKGQAGVFDAFDGVVVGVFEPDFP